jgi:HlyD family secretion protein
LEERKDVLAVNESLLNFKNDSTFVQVEVKDQVFEERYVKTGISDGINIEILEGISKKDKLKGKKQTKMDMLKNNKKKKSKK